MKFIRLISISAFLLLIIVLISKKQVPSEKYNRAETRNPSEAASKNGIKRSTLANHRPEERPKTFITATPDHEALLQEAIQLSKNKRKHRFATAIPVSLTPNNSGEWVSDGDRDTWQLGIESPGASSLNLGFKSYHMPEGGELSIQYPDGKRPYRSFTSDDNESHGELWTPLLHGDKMVVQVSLPSGTRDQLALKLSSINHGFRDVISKEFLKNESIKIGGDSSGYCNIDAVCRSGDPHIDGILGPILDLFQDQIRSVAAYTLQGIDTCSGALINNTRNDKTPYFLTAEHCGINSINDASAVFYFNFQNSYCRARNSLDSDSVGDGDLSQFSSGSILRAENTSSDFCLVELDDPIPDHYDVFFAGWNRINSTPAMAIGIHHPAVAEKRISLETDSLASLGAFWRVNDWDYGTTEGGSSGSPLFDGNGHIVGQLFGGAAACGNDLWDEYGKLSTSWTGGGFSSNRLSNWLAPISTSTTILNGISNSPALTISSSSLTEGNSGTANMIFTVQLSEPSSSNITVNYQTSNQNATAGSDYSSTSGTLTFPSNTTSGTITVPISGDTSAESDETFIVTLSVSSGASIRLGEAIGTIITDDFTSPVLSGSINISANLDTPFSFQPSISNLPASFTLIGDYPLGMTIDSETGLVEWIPPTTGTFSFIIQATNPLGSDTHSVNVNVSNGPNTLDGPDLNNQGVSFTMSTPSWIRSTSVSRDGTDSLESGNIGDNEITFFSVTVNGPGTVSYWLRTSTEEDFDFVHFALNGEILLSESGITNWQQYSYDLEPGPNSLTWIYEKDSSVSAGNDTIWLDDFEFSGYAGWTASHSIINSGLFGVDADSDGAANGLEYATGLSPLNHDLHLVPQATLNSNSLLQLSFSKPLGINDIIYDAEVSNNLKTWNTTERTILTNNGSTFDARQNPSTPTVDQQFMRLRVTPVSP